MALSGMAATTTRPGRGCVECVCPGHEPCLHTGALTGTFGDAVSYRLQHVGLRQCFLGKDIFLIDKAGLLAGNTEVLEDRLARHSLLDKHAYGGKHGQAAVVELFGLQVGDESGVLVLRQPATQLIWLRHELQQFLPKSR